VRWCERICSPTYASAYVSIRQHTSAYVSIRQQREMVRAHLQRHVCVSIRQHTSAAPAARHLGAGRVR
jgi:hypothetical protein